METQPQYLTIKEAAELLGVTPTTLRNWDRSGKLTARRDPVNDYRLYAVEDISQFLGERSGIYTSDHDATPIQPVLFPLASSASNPKEPLDTRSLRLLVRQMSAAFRDSMGGSLLERFEEISKLLYCKLYDERQSQVLENYQSCFQHQHSDSLDETYLRTARLYRSAIKLLPDVLTEGYQKLSDDRKAIVQIIEVLQDVSLINVPVDVKGTVYEELIRNTFEKSDNQQFFTPRPVVEFMVQFLNPQDGQILCDPACGSGGFLIEASKHIHRILGTQASEDSTVYLSNHIIGLEIDKRMAWVAQMNLIMHGDGHGNIHHLNARGSLGFSDHIDQLVQPDSLDLILTNPPFGSDFSDANHLAKYQLGQGRSSRRRGILFIERCIGWLKNGGRLGIIIEDSVLNGTSNSDVRNLILKHCVLEAVISLPDVTFMPYSSAKTSILFLRKDPNARKVQSPIFMANVDHVGRKPNGDPLYTAGRDDNGRPLLQNELPTVIDAWQIYVAKGENAITHLSPKIYICPPDRFQKDLGMRLDVQFHHPSRKVAEDTLRRSVYPTPKLAELVVVRNVTVVPKTQDPDEIWHYIGLGNITAETGEYTQSSIMGSQIKSTVRLFHAGDILFSKLRPELRKCVLIREDEDEGYASSECLVFCTLADAMHDPLLHNVAYQRSLMQQHQIDREYLAFILRSDIIFGQLIYQITGVGRPRVSRSAILGLRIPVPPLSIQREIVTGYKIAWKHYLECRKRSAVALREGDAALKTAYTHTCERLCPTLQRVV